MRKLATAALLTVFLASCSAGGALSLLTGGGPNVAANTQVGATNNQGVTLNRDAPRLTLDKNAKVESVNQSTTNNTEIDPLLLFLLVLGWLLPSPQEMGRGIINLFKRR